MAEDDRKAYHEQMIKEPDSDDVPTETDDVIQLQRTHKTGVAPDGGWGWVIVFAVFMGNFIIDGVIGCFGIFYPALLDAFHASPALSSMAGSLIVAVYMTSAPLIGMLIRRLGCRRVCFIGAITTTTGFVLASWSESIHVFMVTYGVLGGIGIGMNSLCGHLIVNMYFSKKRGLATGIVSAGAGFGVFAMAPLTQHVIQSYTWRGGLLITAGVSLQFCVLAMLMRPLSVSVSSRPAPDSNSTSVTSGEICQETDNKPADKEPVLDDCYNQNGLLSPGAKTKHKHLLDDVYSSHHNIHHSTEDIEVSKLYSLPDLSQIHNKQRVSNTKRRHRGHVTKCEPGPRKHFNPLMRKDIFYSGNLCHLKEFQQSDSVEAFLSSMTLEHGQVGSVSDEGGEDHVTTKKEGLCDWSVFRNPVYVPMLVGGSLIQMGQFIPSTFLPEYCYTVGLSPSDASIVIALYGVLNIAGRLSAGCLANIRGVNPLIMCNFGMLMSAICCALFPLCTTFSTLCLYSCSFGYFIGYFPPLQILALVRYLGLDKLTSAVGFVQLAKGPAALIGPPLAGIIYEWTHDYATCMVFAAVLFLFSAIVPSLVPLIQRFSPKKKPEPVPEMEIIVTEDLSYSTMRHKESELRHIRQV